MIMGVKKNKHKYTGIYKTKQIKTNRKIRRCLI